MDESFGVRFRKYSELINIERGVWAQLLFYYKYYLTGSNVLNHWVAIQVKYLQL